MNTMLYKKSGALFSELLSKSWVEKLVEAFSSPIIERTEEEETEALEEETTE